MRCFILFSSNISKCEQCVVDVECVNSGWTRRWRRLRSPQIDCQMLSKEGDHLNTRWHYQKLITIQAEEVKKWFWEVCENCFTRGNKRIETTKKSFNFYTLVLPC
ncbi:hypothetical protein CHUAL_008470 [Chamberlinius hualienensis]